MRPDRIVGTLLMRLSADHRVREPGYTWADLRDRWGEYAFGIRLDRELYYLCQWYPVEATLLLTYVVAHEFRHYLTVARHMGVGLPKGRAWRADRKAMAEQQADGFAQQLTGVSGDQFRATASQLSDEWRTYYYGI